MKQFFGILFLFALLTLLLPLGMLLITDSSAAVMKPQSVPELPTVSVSSAAPDDSTETVLLWDEGSGQLLQLSAAEYILGAVASEMPADFQPDALRAQGIAAHSYLLACRDTNGQNPELQGGWLKVNVKAHRGYISEEERRILWKDTYEEKDRIYREALQGAEHQLLTYEDQPALACYHAISCGKTAASETVWGKALPYLISVDSPYDLAAEGYEETVSYTPQELYDLLTVNFAGISLTDKPEKWFLPLQYTEEGYVKELTLSCGITLDAQDFRRVLGLRSCAFAVAYQDGSFLFTTKGYGHGVGMSQTGANFMAQTGKSYQEILAYYYPGTLLTDC